MSMRAAVLLGGSASRIETVSIPPLGPHDVLVRLEGTGICASNLPMWEGRGWFRYPGAPGAPGHEGWGIVDRVGGAVTSVAPGRRVALLSSHAYAQYDVADAHALVDLPRALDGRPVPGEPLACAMNIRARAPVAPGSWVVIVGIGFLGAVLTRLATLDGARVIGVSRRASARALAERFGAVATVAFGDLDSTAAELRDRLGEALAPTVIECVGTQESLDLASHAAGIRARLVIAGYHQDGRRTIDLQDWNWKGLDVINAHERDAARYVAGMKDGLALLEDGSLDLAPLLSEPLPLSALDEAFRRSVERPGGFVKGIVDPWRV